MAVCTSAASSETYTIVHKLGHGTWATVFKATPKSNGAAVAIKKERHSLSKCCKNADFNHECDQTQHEFDFEDVCLKESNSIAHEIEILRKAGPHPHIAVLLDWGDKLHVTPLYLGDAFTLLLGKHDKAMPLGRQISAALAHLHGQGIAHCDLTSTNVLVQTLDPLHVVLSDFGSSRELLLPSGNVDGSKTTTCACGTSFSFASPECFWFYTEWESRYFGRNKTHTNDARKCDVWALGMCMLYTVRTFVRNGRWECPSVDDDNKFEAMFKFKALSERVGCVSDELGQPLAEFIFQRLLRHSTALRPTADECVEWFQQHQQKIALV